MNSLELKDVVKSYKRGDEEVRALDAVRLTIHQGEFVSIMGPSGCGKSTLLHLLGGLDTPTSGQVLFTGTPLQSMTDDQLSTYREQHVGFIFQFFNLLATLCAWENVALPLFLAGIKPQEARSRAMAALKTVDLETRADHRPHQMSGGQMQRVAIARALVGKPELLLADEPTGNLDSVTGKEILQLLQHCQREKGQTVVMVTHDSSAADFGTRVVRMVDGRIVSDQEVVRLRGTSV